MNMKNLQKTARRKAVADEAYRWEFSKVVRDMQPLEDDNRFWAILDLFASNVSRRLTHGECAVKEGAHNLMCQLVYQTVGCSLELEQTVFERWHRAVQFVLRFDELVSQLGKSCHAMLDLERSGDGFGDLMDSLPFAGREVCARVVYGSIKTWSQLEDAVSACAWKGTEFIWSGENYISMALDTVIRKAFIAAVRNAAHESEELTTEGEGSPSSLREAYEVLKVRAERCQDTLDRVLSDGLRWKDHGVLGKLMTAKEWLGAVKQGDFIDCDGTGRWSTKDRESSLAAIPSDWRDMKQGPVGMTHVHWYNR